MTVNTTPTKISELATPALIIDQTILKKNIQTMNQILKESNIRLRPHYKSHRCIEIAKLQMENGPVGITCSKLGEAADLVSHGFKDVLIANQITATDKIHQLAKLALQSHLTVCVDTPENILLLEKIMEQHHATLYILIEYEIGMKRCGVNTKEEFLALVQLIFQCKHLRFMGIQAYAGQLSHEADYDLRLQETMKVEKRLSELIAFLDEHQINTPVVSGCSTGTIGFRTQFKSVYTEFQAGSYLFMDSTYNQLALPFESSLFMLATVISTKENRIVTDVGAKSFSMDQNLPMLLSDCPYSDTVVNEEHTIHTAFGHHYHVNDTVKYIPGHCCATINMFDAVYLTEGDKVIQKLDVTSRGKSF